MDLRRVAVRGAAAVVAMLCLSTVMVAMTPQTASAIDVLPTPAGWGGSNQGNGSQGGPGLNYDCSRSTSASFRGRLSFVVYPGCFFFYGPGGSRYNWQWLGRTQWCPVAYEVWRFYGTRLIPVQSMTTERLLLDPCQTAVAPVVHEYHPEDSASTGYNVGVMAPYRWTMIWWDRATPTSVGVLGNDTLPVRYVFTANPPFRRSGTCTTMMARDPNARRSFFGGDLFDPSSPMYNDTRYYWSVMSQWTGRWWANAMFDVTSDAPDGLVVNDNGIPCSGPFDFSVPAQTGVAAIDQADVRVSGYCAIPVARKATPFYNQLTGEWWWAPRVPNDGTGEGSRELYLRSFGERSNGLVDTRPQNQAVIDAYRSAVAQEVASRPGAGVVTPSIEGSWLPPQASENNDNLFWAAVVSSQYSFCNMSQGNRYSNPDDPANGGGGGNTTLPGDSVKVTINVPEAGQSGGAAKTGAPSEVSVTTSNILCGGTPCPVDATNGPFLEPIPLTGSGLTVTAPTNPFDFRMLTTPDASPLRPGVDKSATMEFFEPTEGTDMVAGLSLGQAYKTGFVGSNTTNTICAPAMLGGACNEVSSNTRRQVREPINTVVVCRVNAPGSPRHGLETAYDPAVGCTFPVVGATATPTENRQSR